MDATTPRTSPIALRVTAFAAAVFAALLVVLEVVLMVPGLDGELDGNTVDPSAVLLVHGVFGSAAILTALVAAVWAGQAYRDGGWPRLGRALALLPIAVLAGAIWALGYISAYGD